MLCSEKQKVTAFQSTYLKGINQGPVALQKPEIGGEGLQHEAAKGQMGSIGEEDGGENNEKAVSKSFALRCLQTVKDGYANCSTCQTVTETLKHLFPYLSSYSKDAED